MDVQLRITTMAIATSLAIVFSASAFAHDNANVPVTAGGSLKPVHCEQEGSGPTYCGNGHVRYSIETPAEPRCVKGKTWGSDNDRGVWVSGGCSGDFDAFPITEGHSS